MNRRYFVGVLGAFVCSGLLGVGALVIIQGVASGHRIVSDDQHAGA
jgi:hypothetical protein